MLVSPPFTPVWGESEKAEGRVARFSFTPRFFEEIADEVGLRRSGLKGSWHAFFAIDQRLESLCSLLMDETENQCPNGRIYFEPLSRALAVAVLSTVRNQQEKRIKSIAVPPGIGRVVQCLETHFDEDLSLDMLAAQAQLSRSYFAQAFRQATGYSPHHYLLRVRLSRARQLLSRENKEISLSEIAVACGFFDQAHFSRHFRRFFGTTPTAFRQQSQANPHRTKEQIVG